MGADHVRPLEHISGRTSTSTNRTSTDVRTLFHITNITRYMHGRPCSVPALSCAEIMAETVAASSQKRNRRGENVTRSLRNIMKRLDTLRSKYDVDIYFCARHGRYFEYSSSPSFRPSMLDIVCPPAMLETETQTN